MNETSTRVVIDANIKTHRLEVVDNDGVPHPRFEVASPAQAQQHAREFALRVGAEAPQ